RPEVSVASRRRRVRGTGAGHLATARGGRRGAFGARTPRIAERRARQRKNQNDGTTGAICRYPRHEGAGRPLLRRGRRAGVLALDANHSSILGGPGSAGTAGGDG